MTTLPRQTSNASKLFLTADEHYYHEKIIQYVNRPFANAKDMNNTLLLNHNSIVRPNDHVIHIGDFCLAHLPEFLSIIRALNGHHYILDGSHDRSLAEYIKSEKKPQDVGARLTILPKYFEFTYNKHSITLCHYAAARWKKSHYGAFHFFGHSHGNYNPPSGKAIDVGVDCHNYFPIRIEDAIAIADLRDPTN